MDCAIKNNLYLAQNAGYIYYENDVRCKDKHGNTALYYTAMNGNKEFSTYLIKLGALINEVCSFGNTALHIAFKVDSIEVSGFKILLL
jgi:ankyrin repeat protein